MTNKTKSISFMVGLVALSGLLGLGASAPATTQIVEQEAKAESTVRPKEDVSIIKNSEPTLIPTSKPSLTPTSKPTAVPTKKPTPTPTRKPTVAPTKKPIFYPTSTPQPIQNTTTKYSGDMNCDDFSSHSEAQAYFESKGGSASNNVDDLDRNHNGLACESSY